MTTFKELHNEAMDLAFFGDREKNAGNEQKAMELFNEAFDKECEAALMAYNNKHPQPGLSILLQSASYLAVTCNKPREAEKLIGLALSGEAPDEIRHDLRKLLASLDIKEDVKYDTYTIQIPSGEKGVLNALNVMLNRIGGSIRKIAVL